MRRVFRVSPSFTAIAICRWEWCGFRSFSGTGHNAGTNMPHFSLSSQQSQHIILFFWRVSEVTLRFFMRTFGVSPSSTATVICRWEWFGFRSFSGTGHNAGSNTPHFCKRPALPSGKGTFSCFSQASEVTLGTF